MQKIRKQRRNKKKSVKLNNLQIDKPILLIEDQKSLAKLLATMLTEKWGCDVHIAYSLDEAKSALTKHRHEYHVAICDLNLPDAPNGEVVDLLNKAKVQAIALTGSFGNELRETMSQKGVVDYILKDSVNSYDYVVGLVGRLHFNQHTKILLADDSLSSRALLKHILVQYRLNVFTANNGVEALSILEQHPDIKILIADYNMPEMDGLALTIEARNKYPKENLSIIGISGMGDIDLGAQFIKHGANDFLVKPFSHEELLYRITQNIEILEYMEAIRNIANRDYLTKLYNRRYFFHEGEDIHENSSEHGTQLCVAMIDIDHFKQVNDTYGHDCGDEILVKVSETLNRNFNDHLVARIGGEEFAVLMSDINQEQSLHLLEKFRRIIEETEILYGDTTVSITVSIGFNRDLKENLDNMLKIADENLYSAKNSGRNQVIG